MATCHCLWVPEVDDDRELRLAVHRQPRERAVSEALECSQERDQNPVHHRAGAVNGTSFRAIMFSTRLTWSSVREFAG
jgi:hypothetical protein